MVALFRFIRQIRNVVNFMGLIKERRRIVFYSEGLNYWVHLEGLVKEFLVVSEVPVCYISSNGDDPGLMLRHENYRSFEIGEGFIRDWLFSNIDTELMVMTMPDLHQYQVKKSKHNVHYVYVQHSLVSLHMVYRKGAFDYYDTIFCAGPHHVKEMRAIEKLYQLPEKVLVEHGYARLDAIISEKRVRGEKHTRLNSDHINALKHVLIAPSWGKHGIIESGLGEKIVDQLLDRGYKVTLRPHPQTIKFDKAKVDTIVAKYSQHDFFACETNVAGQETLHDSDLMISDWSGAALDYALGLKKPVLFIDTPKKINNKDYDNLDLIPIENYIRNIIGQVVPPNMEHKLPIEECLLVDNQQLDLDEFLFNIGDSCKVGASYLSRYLK